MKLRMLTIRPPFVVVVVLLLLLIAARPARAVEFPTQEFGTRRGGPYEWESADGLAYLYRIPKTFDPREGVDLTFILHGSNLDRHWGFANHRAATFRPDDIVICPDGTTPNGKGGFNFRGKPEDLERLHTLHEELKEALEVRATFIYGHSQGSFFAFHYAGAYPADVQGVVGHASGVWTWTSQPEEAHHQAIVLLHGTKDPVVPYGQSVAGYRSFRKAGYPLVRLRSLEGWNHWPAEHNSPTPHTSQQLAWCEGMTTDDPGRLAASFEVLRAVKEKEWHDYGATYSLARRILKLEGRAPDRLRKRAARAIQAIDRLAASHAKTIVSSMRKNAEARFDGKAWAAHLPLFLRTFHGTKHAGELAEKLAEATERHREQAISHLRKHHAARKKGDEATAFAEGLLAVREGFLHHACADSAFLDRLKAWAKRGKELEIPKESLAEFARLVPAYEKALTQGRRVFETLNRKVARF